MKTLYNEIISFIDEDIKIRQIIDNIAQDANLYLFGGAVRDYLDSNFNGLRDLDFVVEFKDSNRTIDDYLIDSVKYKKNHFDGFKLISHNFSIDIWELKNTWAFRNKLLSPSVDNLFESVYFNIDKVLYSMNTKSYVNECDKLYNKTINNKILDIVLENNPMVELNLLRAIKLCKKYEMKPSDDLKRVFNNYIKDLSFVPKMQNLQRTHYNEEPFAESIFKKLISDMVYN